MLIHPNIIEHVESYINKKQEFNIVMEYADSGNLLQLMKIKAKQNQQFSEDDVLGIFT